MFKLPLWWEINRSISENKNGEDEASEERARSALDVIIFLLDN
jgi:hypothetical protein